MQKGLLGLSFLNHFDMRVDPSRGVITLTENQLEETGLLRGGRSEMQWRTEFESLRRRIESSDEMLEEIPFSRTRKRARVEQTVATLRRHLEVLESEADDARVPFSWR